MFVAKFSSAPEKWFDLVIVFHEFLNVGPELTREYMSTGIVDFLRGQSTSTLFGGTVFWKRFPKSTPFRLLLPTAGPASAKVISINGISVNQNPSPSTFPDITALIQPYRCPWSFRPRIFRSMRRYAGDSRREQCGGYGDSSASIGQLHRSECLHNNRRRYIFCWGLDCGIPMSYTEP